LAVASTPSRVRGVGKNIAIALKRLLRRPHGDVTPVWRAYARLAIGAVMAIAVLILIMILADAAAMRAVKQAPSWLVGAFRFATDLGLSGWFLIPLGTMLLALAVVTSPSLSRMSQYVIASVSVRLGFLFLAIALPGLVIAVIKRLIGRARPMVAGEDVFLYKLFVWRPEYASFPSGHATTAFAAAIAFGVLWPRLRLLMWGYAIVIALSRVIVTAHHPSDVVAGAIAGVVGALLVRDWFAARRLGFLVRADGRVEALPGPSFQRIKRVARGLFGQ
jgi:membrane-associated phospholipid phosphatase